MRCQAVCVVAMLWGGLVISAEAQPQPKPDEVQTYKRLGEVELALHIFRPQGEADEPRPAIVFFFGGGWTQGTPSQFYRQSRQLADRGMLAVCADYRVRSRHQTTPAESVADAKSAVRYLRQHAQRLNIDPERIAAGGGSAGGHLAAATATVPGFEGEGFSSADEALDISSRPNALVLFNPVTDPAALGRGLAGRFPDARKLSPLAHVGPGQPPTILFHGTADTTVGFDTAKAFTEAMQAAGNRCELVSFPDAGHGFFNRGQPFTQTLEATDRFFVALEWILPR